VSGLVSLDRESGLRARRWDAVVLGSGCAALFCAVRIAESGQRVLVLQEDAVRDQFPGIREPFLLQGLRDGGALDTALRELKLPLIDRHRIDADPVAFQLVGSELRLDLGAAQRSAEELVSWKLCDEAFAGEFVRAITEAAEAERRAMENAPIVRVGRRRFGGRGIEPSHMRGLPAEVREAPSELRALLDEWIRAVSNLGTAAPSPEARSRLLGSVMHGGARFAGGPPWLADLLQRRLEAVYGEIRTIAGPFELVVWADQPGVQIQGSGDVWVGRSLVIAAPATGLRNELAQAPKFLPEPAGKRRRLAFHWSVARNQLPEGLAARAILLGDEAFPRSTPIQLFERGVEDEIVDLVARVVADPEEDPEEIAPHLEARLRKLLPFAGDQLVARPVRRAAWDDEGWLEDPRRGAGWPTESDLRVSSRPPVYRLDRTAVAGLGIEGDLLLGWRAGDAIAAELE